MLTVKSVLWCVVFNGTNNDKKSCVMWQWSGVVSGVVKSVV